MAKRIVSKQATAKNTTSKKATTKKETKPVTKKDAKKPRTKKEKKAAHPIRAKYEAVAKGKLPKVSRAKVEEIQSLIKAAKNLRANGEVKAAMKAHAKEVTLRANLGITRQEAIGLMIRHGLVAARD